MIIAALIAASMNLQAASFITISDNYRINPNKLGGYETIVFLAHFDGYCDSWSLAMTYPQGMTTKLVAGIKPLEGMIVDYVDRNGNDATLCPELHVSAAYAGISSYLVGDGWWDYNNDGILESYGSIKWEPGYYRMFEMTFYVDWNFRKGNLIIDGHITSGTDRRGPVLSDVIFYRSCHLWVGYTPGDVTGDGIINIADVVMMVDYLLNGHLDNEFQEAATDADGDGKSNIADLTLIIDKMLEQ